MISVGERSFQCAESAALWRCYDRVGRIDRELQGVELAGLVSAYRSAACCRHSEALRVVGLAREEWLGLDDGRALGVLRRLLEPVVIGGERFYLARDLRAACWVV